MQARRIDQLRQAIAAIETGPARGRRGRAIRPVDPLSVPARGVHEWFGAAAGTAARWTPPLGILMDLARRRLDSQRWVVWIGRRCWPYPRALERVDRRLPRRSLFVDPPDGPSRLWAIELAARCPAVAAVVADGSALEMAATRRLQLAAEAGSAAVLCVRPPGELKHLSAAAVRWLVRSSPSPDGNPRWIVELLRCKGVQPESMVHRLPGGRGPVRGPRVGRRWTVEWKGARSGVAVHAALAGGSGAAEQTDAGRARRSA